MVTNTPWGDVFDEFTARNIPYGFDDDDKEQARRKRTARHLEQLVYPDEDGELMGRARVPVTTDHLKTRVERWNEYYNAKLRIIEGEIRDLNIRRGPFWHPIMLIVTAIFAFAVFLAVLAVDYAVLSEFWARVYSNEFGEVPPAFAASVIIKSLQVVGAALAFHFFYQTLTRDGRRYFVYFVFIVTLLFLLGLGFLNAGNSLPAGSTLSVNTQAEDQAEENRRVLEALGLADEEGEATDAEPDPAEEEAKRAAENRRETVRFAYDIAWFSTLLLLFVAVTSVAAMMLHVALRAVSGLFGRIDNEHYFSSRSILNKRDMNLRLLRARRAREWLRSEKARGQLMKHCLASFETGYIFGLFGDKDPSLGARMRRAMFGERRIEIARAEADATNAQNGAAGEARALLDQLSTSMGQVREMIDAGAFDLVVETSDEESFVEADNERELRRQQHDQRRWDGDEDEEEADAEKPGRKDEKDDKEPSDTAR